MQISMNVLPTHVEMELGVLMESMATHVNVHQDGVELSVLKVRLND